ncbi:MAG: hypothetical protein VZQ97_05270 [Candidatus Onthomonas sp.]|nr:hypothetical protein [Candidatus Onthomonas sp.]
MSYICLMVNENGAVAGADSRESFRSLAHLDWRRKCFSLPEKRLIWTCCGPTIRLGVDFFRASRLIFRGRGSTEEHLGRIGRLVANVTRVPIPGGDVSGVFCLLAAQWEDGGFTVWNMSVAGGKPVIKRQRPAPGEAVSLHAGAWRRKMPPLAAQTLVPLSYEELEQKAQERVALAIEMDALRKEKDRKYHPSIGGRVRTTGIRVKH